MPALSDRVGCLAPSGVTLRRRVVPSSHKEAVQGIKPKDGSFVARREKMKNSMRPEKY